LVKIMMEHDIKKQSIIWYIFYGVH
jgi:hypothetical protein